MQQGKHGSLGRGVGHGLDERRQGCAPLGRNPVGSPNAFLCSVSTLHAGGYRRLDSALALKGTLDADTTTVAVRVEVATATMRDRSVFNVVAAVLDVGPVRRA